jgi:hypothetical protein
MSRTSGIVSSPSPDLFGSGVVTTEALRGGSSKEVSAPWSPWYDASEPDSSLKTKEGAVPASGVGETSETKPRKLADPSSTFTPADGTEGGVLLAPEAEKEHPQELLRLF